MLSNWLNFLRGVGSVMNPFPNGEAEDRQMYECMRSITDQEPSREAWRDVSRAMREALRQVEASEMPDDAKRALRARIRYYAQLELTLPDVQRGEIRKFWRPAADVIRRVRDQLGQHPNLGHHK